MNEQHVINLTDKERFVNAVAEIAEGDFHPSNVKYNLVGDYSKAVGCGDLDTFILYEIAHEKQHQRVCMFSHMVKPFWANYDKEHTSLTLQEKYLIFLKVLNEVGNIFSLEIREEILYAMEDILNITPAESGHYQNGKMWHDYYLDGYEEYAISRMKRDSQGLYF